jgi:hypothetical protein
MAQALSRNLVGFYTDVAHVPGDLRLSLLTAAERHVTLHELDHADDHAISSSLSETDRILRVEAVDALKKSIRKTGLDLEVSKAIVSLRSMAHTFLFSAISENLRHLFATAATPFELYEQIHARFETTLSDNNPTVIANQLRQIKFTSNDSIDAIVVELSDLMKRFRESMIPPTFATDPESISSVDYDRHVWTNHTLCAMADTFVTDKDIWETIKNAAATARASGSPVVIDDVWIEIRRIIQNRVQRASALGDHGTAATSQARSHFASAAVPASLPTWPSLH